MKDIHLEGTALTVAGKCPDVSFTVSGRRVTADKSTDYKKGKCSDLSSGDRVAVDGKDNGTVVTATKIEFKNDDHD